MTSVAMCGMGPGLFFEQETAQFEVNQPTIVNDDADFVRKVAIEAGDAVLLELVGTSYEKVTLLTGAGRSLPSSLVGVALENANHGDTVRVGLRGEFKCRVRAGGEVGGELIGSSVAGCLGDPANVPAADPAVYHKLVGIEQESAGTDGDRVTIFFDGITGIMGTHN